ncbi:MAG: 3-dehydroquinate synthase [Nocardioidaceae bacterium]|nr:3-dehydroquinate synthase [Nocardioidaceae bacterium]
MPEVEPSARAGPSDVTRIRVEASSPYDVVVGRQLLGELPSLLPAGVRRVAVIHPQALSATGIAIRDDLNAGGFEVHAIEIPNGEEAKTSEVAAFCWKALGQVGFTRSDAIVGVGGGATTDLAGFVAATFLRGLAVVHIPTTLLGMVDAAVGGKTGINTAEGKNLVGSFHEPVGVLCDLASLETLNRHEVVSGLAEAIKCGFISDPDILTLVEEAPEASVEPGSAENRVLIERAIAVKAAYVSHDYRESTSSGTDVGREALNYGHTMGHAIELAERYQFRHGAAVAIGMVYVAELARLAGRLDEATADRHRSILTSVGLPTSYGGAEWAQLHAAMKVDKKARADRLRFVIIEQVGKPAILEAPDPALLTAAFAEISR